MLYETDNNLRSLLTTVGINKNEAAILELLLKLENATAGTIAKRTGLKRPTTYLNLHSLVEKGFINKKTTSKSQIFSCIPHQSLIDQLKSQTAKRTNLINLSLKQLETLFAALPKKTDRSTDGFQIESVSSDKGIYEYLHHSLTSEPFCSVFHPDLLTPQARKIAISFLEETAKKNRVIKEIVKSNSDTEWYSKRITTPNHKIKLAPKNWSIDCDLIFSKTQITLISYQKKESTALRITHQAFVDLLQSMFDQIWENL